MNTSVERPIGGVMNGNAIWLTCRECGHTSRVLALLASRVIKTRSACPECASTSVPCLNSTPVGTGLSLSDEQKSALREMDDPALHALVARTPVISPQNWVRNLQGRVIDRFTHRRSYGSLRAPFEPQTTDDFHPAAGTITPTGTAIRL
ncbi:MAG: hypothetical protein ACRYF4_03680 [Janthinobacterium lividum]